MPTRIGVTPPAATPATYPPSGYGWLAWTGDPALFSGATALTTGRLDTAELYCAPGTITHIVYHISTQGTTLTAGQCFAGLWATGAGGAQLALTADQSTNLGSAAGTVVTAALTTPYAHAGGYIRVGIYAVFGGTAPQLLRGTANNVNNAGLTVFRFGHSNATTYTTTPPATLPALSAQTSSWWFGLKGS